MGWTPLIGIGMWRRGGGSAAPETPDGNPSNLVLTVVSDTEIDGTFTEGSTNQDGFRVYISTDGVTFNEKTTVTSGSFQATGLTANHYWFYVVAYKGSVESDPTDTATNEVPLCVYDGNTVGWYVYDDMATVILAGSDVAQWNDKLGSGHDLKSPTYRPTWESDGILFNGSEDYLQTDAFTFNQPAFFYLVLKQITWTNNKYLFDGNDAKTILQQQTGTPGVKAFAGSYSSVNNNLTLDTFAVVRCLFNGASSKLQINDTTATTGNFGTNNPGAFALGHRYGTSYYSNIKVKEVILRKIADSSGDESDIYEYLKKKNNLIDTETSEEVEIAGYADIETSATTLTNSNPGTYYLNQNNRGKIRCNGTLTKIKFYTKEVSDVTNYWFQVWRNIEGTYTVIYEEDIKSKLTENSINEITLTSSVNVEEGDMMSIGVNHNATIDLFEAVDASADSLPSIDTKQTTGYDWDSLIGDSYLIPLKAYGNAPIAVAIGDSIVAGHPGHYSYIENSKTDLKANSFSYQMYLLNNKWRIQNMGIGSQTTTLIRARFTNDVVNLNPLIAIINGGVNDISGGSITKGTFLSNWETVLFACYTADIIPIVLKVLPWTNGDNTEMQTRDDWMTDLKALVETYDDYVWVDFDEDLGQFREGGDDGNLWDLKTDPDYDQDGVHPTALGYAKMAEVINREFVKKYTLL